MVMFTCFLLIFSCHSTEHSSGLKMRKFLKRYINNKRYKTSIEALQLHSTLKKLIGLTVFQLKSHPELRITSEFTPMGLVLFMINVASYSWCAYKAIVDDQTVFRNLYPTRLRHYGDKVERSLSLLLVMYCMWKIPFHFGLSTGYIKKILDIDQKIENLGYAIDYGAIAFHFFSGAILQLFFVIGRLVSVLVTLSSLDMNVPFEVVNQDTFTDALALGATSFYCHYVNIIRSKYKIINKLLSEIRDGRSWEQKILVRGRNQLNKEKFQNYQDKHVCEKMRSCAKIYGMLFNVTQEAQNMFGFTLACTMLFCHLYIILYLFYFMEATAFGLFQDTRRYVYFIIYILWQLLYTLGIILLNIYFSEACVQEATKSSFIIHQIINADISPSITIEAMRFSQQILHQVPEFTACGLCNIDYRLLLQGTYNVTTFLVILLQFVT